MRAVKITTSVTKDRTLQLDLPEEIGEGPAEVIVLVGDMDDRAEPRPDSWTLDDFLAESRLDERFIRSKEDIDAYVRSERKSWE